MSLTDPTTLGARLDALAREDDDIPDRLRTLAREPDESPLVKAFGAWTPLAPETVPTDADRERIRAWLDRPAQHEHWCAVLIDGCNCRVPSWRAWFTWVPSTEVPGLEHAVEPSDCTCNPGPVPVEGGFVWRRCSCDNLETEAT